MSLSRNSTDDINSFLKKRKLKTKNDINTTLFVYACAKDHLIVPSDQVTDKVVPGYERSVVYRLSTDNRIIIPSNRFSSYRFVNRDGTPIQGLTDELQQAKDKNIVPYYRFEQQKTGASGRTVNVERVQKYKEKKQFTENSGRFFDERRDISIALLQVVEEQFEPETKKQK